LVLAYYEGEVLMGALHGHTHLRLGEIYTVVDALVVSLGQSEGLGE